MGVCGASSSSSPWPLTSRRTVTWAGEGELWVVGPPKVAPAKVHQAQLSGEGDE